jgi:hypothetical protein
MAGFTVPNATDFGLGNIASLDQSEPDSLDFSSIGDHRHGVISGANITTVASAAGNATPAYLNVTLSAVEVRIDNTYGSVAGATVVVAAAPSSSDTRFDVIVAYNNSGTFQFDVVQGTASATNPVFPTLTDTQIPLYAVYVKNTFNTTYTTELIVDKRAFTSSSLSRVASGVPAGGTGAVGDTYVTTTSPSNNGQSQIYVKTGASTWTNLATYVAMASANTANTLVQRDASGNFTAGTVTATTFSGSGASLTSIPGSALNNTSVATGKIADGAITVAKLATGAPRAGFNSTRSTTTGNYTVSTSDVGKLVELSATSANITVTVPGTGFADGDRIDLLQTSSNTYRVTIQGDAGVTVSAEGNKKTLKAQWAGATLINRGTNTWVLIGNLTA